MVGEAPDASGYFKDAPKVHSGFRYAWQTSGLRQQVFDLIQANCSEDKARSVNVFLTGNHISAAMHQPSCLSAVLLDDVALLALQSLLLGQA